MLFSNLCGVEKDRGDTEKNSTGSIKKDNTALTTKKKKTPFGKRDLELIQLILERCDC